MDLDAFRFITASAYAGMMAPLTGLPSTVAVLSGDTDTGPADPAREALSLERLDGVRRRWRLGDLARLADFVPKLVALAPADKRPTLVVPPRRTGPWEQSATPWPADIALLGRPAADVTRIADDKVFVREEVARLGVSVPAAVVRSSDSIVDGFGPLADLLGVPFVLQVPQGAGGTGTYLVRSAEELTDLAQRRASVPRWLVSAFAGELTVNVTGVVDALGVGELTASVQSSGIGEIGSGFGAYCGSDFGRVATVPAAALSTLYDYGARIGEWLHGLGHRGLFGADFAVDGASVAFLEVNPRVQGSSWLLSALQNEAGREASLTAHVRALLGGEIERPARPATPWSGSHLLIRWTGPEGLVRSVPCVPESSGVTVTGLPAVGSIIVPGAILARFASPASLTMPTGSALTDASRAVLGDVIAGVEVSPPRS